MHYWISNNGATQGPYAESQIRSMWQNGAITADYLCWREGFSSWVSVESILAAKQSKGSTQPIHLPQGDKPQAPDVKKLVTSKSYEPAELLKIVSYSGLMANFNVVAVILSALVGFAEKNTTGNSNEATLILLGNLLAFPCWILTCYYVYVLMRAMETGRLGASICVIVVFFIPFVSILTTISIYFMAKKELVKAGVKIGSASFMKNQINRMGS